MTGRQRLSRLLDREPFEGLAWTTLVDDTSRSLMPQEVRRLHPFDFYRFIGCDILSFGNYGLPEQDQVPLPAQFVCPQLQTAWQTTQEGPLTRQLHTRTMPWGTLTTEYHNGHPVKYPVNNLEEIRILRQMWEAASYTERPGTAKALARTEQLIGEDGLYIPTTEPSPVQQLIEYDMGMENFYHLLQDYPQEVEGLMAAMHAKRCQEYEIIARRMASPAVIPVENTSSTMTSPEIYRVHSLPQIRDYRDILHAHGKKIVLHMCGHLKALLPVLGQTGADGFNATTPPPVGTTHFEDVLDAYGDDFVILGGILDPAVLQKPGITEREIHEHLDHLYTPRLRRANLLLWLGVDGLATPLERFTAVGNWMRHCGAATLTAR